MLDLQRRLGAGGGVVVEGRDTGTVVFPAAEAKFFLTASERGACPPPRRRARARRHLVDYNDTLAEIRERDQRDSSRDVAPMEPAADAVVVDSSTQTLEQVVESLAGQVALAVVVGVSVRTTRLLPTANPVDKHGVGRLPSTALVEG